MLVLLLGITLPARSAATLNVSIVAFDPGVPDDKSTHRDLKVFPRIREIEAMLLPFVLREALADSGDWGAVRVIPESDTAAELLVTGEIGHSDGTTQELYIRAVDASGRVWLDTAFAGAAGGSHTYDLVAGELRQARARLTERDLEMIAEISMLRYGAQLAPSAFSEYMDIAADGTVTVLRMPARNDPMLERIRRIRETEYVITDAVDAKFEELHADIATVFDLWRKYRRKTVEYEATNAERAEATASAAPRGSYEALLDQYENYKWDRMTAQEQDRLAVAFDNEIGPKVTAMEARVRELEAWVDLKYAEWHRLLEALFDAETSEGRAVDEDLVNEIDELLD